MADLCQISSFPRVEKCTGIGGAVIGNDRVVTVIGGAVTGTSEAVTGTGSPVTGTGDRH